MATDYRDQNGVVAAMGVSSTNGTIVFPFYVDPTTHALLIEDAAGGADITGDDALRSENFAPSLAGVSSGNTTTPVPLYVDQVTNALLVNSN